MDRDYKFMNKDLIKQRFSKSLKSYNNNAMAQKIMAKKLVSKINKDNCISVLELGCGTGLITKEVYADKIFYDAIDIVPRCEEYIKKISDKINFICEDIEEFIPEKKYDLIISNATLQWIENLPEFISRYIKFLNPGGIIGFTIFGKNNYNELNELVDGGLLYYSKNDIEKMFKNYKIIYLEEELITLEFSEVKDVLYHIKNTGVNAICNTRWTKKDLLNFENNYPKKNNKIVLTYNPVYVILQNR